RGRPSSCRSAGRPPTPAPWGLRAPHARTYPPSPGSPLLPPASLVGPGAAERGGGRRSRARLPRKTTRLAGRLVRCAIPGGSSNGGGDSGDCSDQRSPLPYTPPSPQPPSSQRSP
ncbi:hypothetical protein P7K49_001096, partial [Saguinus oedipus]